MSSQKEWLDQRWSHYMERDIEEERRSLIIRYEELQLSYSREIAARRLQIEAFCYHKIFLPKQGLTLFKDTLQRRGFYFEEYGDSTLLKALIPRSWKLEPASEFFVSPAAFASIAYLVEIDYGRYAQITYLRTERNHLASIIPVVS